MSRFSAAEREFDHALPQRTGVLLVQLGTPQAPETSAVRRYLREFLSDPRVVEIPRLIWALILNGIILNVRPAKSAQKYASIWTPEGSPLAVHTEAQSEAVQRALSARGHDVRLAWAMRYGSPSVTSVMRRLREDNVSRVLVVPLYPQYAGSTTATAFDEVFRELLRWRNQPELRTVRSFPAHSGYIEALARHIERGWAVDGPPDCLVMSFHGVPRRTLLLGDPYHCECHVTGRLLAQRLGLAPDRYRITFQSRFGKAEWLQPYTDASLHELAKQGARRVDVVCPGFVADCLETLEEIAMEGRDTFMEAGGQDYRYISCLNGSDDFASAMADLIVTHLAGWPTLALSAHERQQHEQCLAARAERARRMGAAR
jgi:protoporphyrin/coproporphyrin ferrochelatase